MNRSYVDPWATEKMSRSEAQRRYVNVITYQIRPMLANRSLSEDARVQVLKRAVREANRFRYESGTVAGGGAREEVVEILSPYLHPEHPAGEELRDWVKRTIRAFGASFGNED